MIKYCRFSAVKSKRIGQISKNKLLHDLKSWLRLLSQWGQCWNFAEIGLHNSFAVHKQSAERFTWYCLISIHAKYFNYNLDVNWSRCFAVASCHQRHLLPNQTDGFWSLVIVIQWDMETQVEITFTCLNCYNRYLDLFIATLIVWMVPASLSLKRAVISTFKGLRLRQTGILKDLHGQKL